MLQSYNDVLTVDEVCEILHIGKTNAYKLIKEGQVPSIKVGRQIRISKELLKKYISNEYKVCYNDSTQWATSEIREVN